MDGGEDGGGFGEAAGAEFVAGHDAFVGADDVDAAGAEGGHVGGGRGVQPHADVHGGGDEDGLVGGEQEGGGEIVGEAGGHFGEDVGAGGGDDDEVGGAAELDVAHLAFVGERPEVGVDAGFGEGLEAEGGDEVGAAFGEHGGDGVAGFAEEADEFEGFVGGDAAGDDQEDAVHGATPHPGPLPREREKSGRGS